MELQSSYETMSYSAPATPAPPPRSSSPRSSTPTPRGHSPSRLIAFQDVPTIITETPAIREMDVPLPLRTRRMPYSRQRCLIELILASFLSSSALFFIYLYLTIPMAQGHYNSISMRSQAAGKVHPYVTPAERLLQVYSNNGITYHPPKFPKCHISKQHEKVLKNSFGFKSMF
jgi:hypothetical protein